MSAVFTPTRYRLSVEDYHKLGAAGILKADSRVELIEGELIEMAPIGSLHAATVVRLHELFYEQTRNSALVWQQNPITLLPQSEPQPDLTLLQFRADHYAHALPSAADVLLIVEVSDSTLEYDRGEKLRLFSRHNIPEYWIVDLQTKRLEVYSEPYTKGYTRKLDFNAQDTVSPLALLQVKIALEKVLS